MSDKPFDKPVQILTGANSAVVRRVDTTLQAVDYLLHKWPVRAAGSIWRLAGPALQCWRA